MEKVLIMVYGESRVDLESQKIELADSKKVNAIIKKYNSIKNTDRGSYSKKFDSIKKEVTKNIDSLGDIIDDGKKYLRLLKELGADKDYKELDNVLMNAKEDFDVMLEVLDLVKKF